MLFKKQKTGKLYHKRCNVIAFINITVSKLDFSITENKKQEEPVNYGKMPIYIVKIKN